MADIGRRYPLRGQSALSPCPPPPAASAHRPRARPARMPRRDGCLDPAEMQIVRRALADAAAVLLPVDCSGCGAPGRAVCAVCERELAGDFVRRMVDEVPVVSSCAYEGAPARMIAAFKDSGRIDASRALAGALCRSVVEALADDGASGVLAVPVAGSMRAFRRRGYDPLLMLTARARIPTHRLLRLSRRVLDQSALDARQRHANRSGALVARRLLEGRSVLLLDDVVTTGATLSDAIAAVRAAGGAVVGAATIAATPLRRTRPGQPGSRPGDDPALGLRLLRNSKTSIGNPDGAGLGSLRTRR